MIKLQKVYCVAVSIGQGHIKGWQRDLQKKSYKLMYFAKFQKVAIKKQNVYKLFDVLQGTATVNSIQHINMHLTEDQKKLLTTKWKGEKLDPVVDQAQSLAVAL